LSAELVAARATARPAVARLARSAAVARCARSAAVARCARSAAVARCARSAARPRCARSAARPRLAGSAALPRCATSRAASRVPAAPVVQARHRTTTGAETQCERCENQVQVDPHVSFHAATPGPDERSEIAAWKGAISSEN
jgi:hypothetical protein